jgi:hypothetical protein
MANAESAGVGQNLTARQTKFTHPSYTALAPTWLKLRDVREGAGGFLDGTYLIAHPREYKDHTSDTPTQPTKKLIARRKLASYENFAAKIITAMKSALCREQPLRRVGEEEASSGTPLEEWWDNVDGTGTGIDDFMTSQWDLAGTFGHMHIYLDKPENTDALTAADEGQPFLRVYTPLDAWDWLTDDLGRLKAIKFAEVAPRASLEQAYKPEIRVRVVTDTDWTLYDASGKRIGYGEHQMGRLPVVTLYAERRPMDQTLGATVLGDPNLYIDLYNLISENRELLRNQTFGILNVPLGTGEGAMTLTEAQEMMGKAVGTENVLFSGAAADFIQPSAENVGSYHAEIARKLRSIYRLAGLQWESDSKDAEAEGSLQLKREEMNQRLSAFADEMERAEYELAELFYRATEGAEKGADAIEKEGVTIKYPDTFDVAPFEALIEEAQAARDLGMPSVFLKAQRKMLLTKFTGMADLPQSQLDEIEKAIESAPDDLTPAEQAQQRLDLTMKAMQMGKPKEPQPPMKDKAA